MDEYDPSTFAAPHPLEVPAGEESSQGFRSVFLDPAWLAALLAGAWGVVIALEDFLVADCFAVAIAIVVCLKVAQEAHIYSRGKRRWIIFTVAVAFVLGTVALDLRWTKRMEKESGERKARLSQLDAIPDLKQQVSDLRQQQTDKASADAIENSKAGQKLADIEDENKNLQHSVDTKDAALVKIAQDEHALNIAPQMNIITSGNDALQFLNTGKVAIEVEAILIENTPQDLNNAPAQIAVGSSISFTMHGTTQATIANRAPGGNADRLPIDGHINFHTDTGSYSVSFTWFFTVKDGVIVSTAVIDRPIMNIKPQ